MFGHLHELILGPAGYGVDRAMLITHEIEIAERHCDGLGANPEKATDVNDGSARGLWSSAP
jgi:hypothetical protein